MPSLDIRRNLQSFQGTVDGVNGQLCAISTSLKLTSLMVVENGLDGPRLRAARCLYEIKINGLWRT